MRVGLSTSISLCRCGKATTPFDANVISGNLWLFDWAFAGMITSSLKLRQKVFLVHSVLLEILKAVVCDKFIGIVFLCFA